VNAARGLGVDAGDLREIIEGSALDCLQGAEVAQQRALARRADARDLLQAGLANIAFAFRPMRADGKAMGLVAQALQEIKHGIARRQLERRLAGRVKRLAAGVAIGSLGNRNQRHIGDANRREHILHGLELTLAAVDDDEIGPGRIGALLARDRLLGTVRCRRG
jgi:hypothetical protein